MFNSLITSSIDPNKVSLAVKGFLVMIVPLIMAFSGMTTEQVTPLVDAIVQAVYFGTAFVSAFMLVYGLLRKWANGRWSAQ